MDKTSGGDFQFQNVSYFTIHFVHLFVPDESCPFQTIMFPEACFKLNCAVKCVFTFEFVFKDNPTGSSLDSVGPKQQVYLTFPYMNPGTMSTCSFTAIFKNKLMCLPL